MRQQKFIFSRLGNEKTGIRALMIMSHCGLLQNNQLNGARLFFDTKDQREILTIFESRGIRNQFLYLKFSNAEESDTSSYLGTISNPTEIGHHLTIITATLLQNVPSGTRFKVDKSLKYVNNSIISSTKTFLFNSNRSYISYSNLSNILHRAKTSQQFFW